MYQPNLIKGKFLEWLYASGLNPLVIGESCCVQEFSSLLDMESLDFLLDSGGVSSRMELADVLVVAGPITVKFADRFKEIFDSMSRPFWVIAIGACASSGGIFRSEKVIQGISAIAPVDIYIPGCPPTRESIIDGFYKLRERITKRERP
ncbi:MAG: hypothetical protein A2504_16335 [Bdellovibrionales bacterium RIFOXYD12_FULL_39_22]|nr:MAG: hypothetical protein A2385_09990 [Bdellovibrionales bacterium RIFOXYB1_FULL_39_21]OFZ45455.1 MAG: hypothetical protein A2404_01235 [Bdellovibrionales bacterium RIFOXYC1_FULL_39_130]OFZ74660.1 MAG: hypothetical protein A2560_09560 [Bdellovibrionales bacterium RIFOXYD1_FULL_39_84]OFZ92969.1 MAG: hypothetical protein A2504_16335 [Bdellovibrionales bacterium RIFOXYD12_FULL_39_22]